MWKIPGTPGTLANTSLAFIMHESTFYENSNFSFCICLDNFAISSLLCTDKDCLLLVLNLSFASSVRVFDHAPLFSNEDYEHHWGMYASLWFFPVLAVPSLVLILKQLSLISVCIISISRWLHHVMGKLFLKLQPSRACITSVEIRIFKV